MKETEGWVKIKKYTYDWKPVCGRCNVLSADKLCQYSKGGIGFFPNYNCPIWHGESKSEWQPIETAPKDGTDCFLYNGHIVGAGYFHAWARDENGHIIGAEKSSFADEWEWCGEGFSVDPAPTHWMPIPSPPKGEK